MLIFLEVQGTGSYKRSSTRRSFSGLTTKSISVISPPATVNAMTPTTPLSSSKTSPGDPFTAQKREAARLLGVARDAPREVIEAALAAQLAMHDARPLDGLHSEMRQVAVDRRQALQRARNLLVGEAAAGPQQ